MKLRSTLLFAAASFTASALAPVAITTSAFFAASSLVMHAEDLTVSGDTEISESKTYDGINVVTASTIVVNEGVVLTASRYTGADDSGATTSLIVDGTMTVTGTATDGSSGHNGSFNLSHWGAGGTGVINGTLNLNSGVSVKDGKGVLTVNNGGVVNFVEGISFSGQGGGITLQMNEGGRMNVGAGGISATTNASWIASSGYNTPVEIVLNGGTLGILKGPSASSSWSTDRGFTLGKSVTFDTTVYAMESDGNSSSATTEGGTINLNGRINLKNDSKLIVTGLGKVVLGESFIFGLDGDSLNGTTFSLADVSTGTLELPNQFGENNFYWNGIVLPGRVSVDTSKLASEGIVSFSGEALNLVWNGGSSGTWEIGGTSNLWLNGTEASDFQNIDSVEFTDSTTNGTIDVASAVTVTDFTVSSGIHTLTRSNDGYVVVSGVATVKNGGTLILDSQTDHVGLIRGAITVEDGGTLQFNKKDITGYNGGVNSLHTITINSGGKLVLNSGGNETFAGTLNLNGTLEAASGSSGNQWDIFGGNSEIIVGANADAKIASGLVLRLRRDDASIEVGENGNLRIESAIVKNSGNGVLHKRGVGTLIYSGSRLDISRFAIDNGAVEFAWEKGQSFTQQEGMIFTGTGRMVISSGKLILTNGGNNFTGTVEIGNGGTLELGASAKLMTGYANGSRLYVYEGGVLRLDNFAYNQLGGSPDYASHRVLDGGSIIITGATSESGQGFTVTEKGGSFVIEKADTTVTLGGNGNTSTAILSGNGSLKLGGSGNIVFNKSAGQIAISGTGSLEKVGAGTLTLNCQGNTFSGGVKVSAGTLVIKETSVLGASKKVTLSGGILKGESASVVIDSESSVIVSSSGSSLGTITLNGGTLAYTEKTSLALLSDVTLTSGVLDLSHIAFDESDYTMTLFTGASEAVLSALSSDAITKTVDGTFDLSDGNIVFTVAEGLRFLRWDLDAEDQTWDADSFSGKAFSAGKKVLFGTADGEKDVTITAAVSSSNVVVDAGAAGTYDFVGSQYLTATAVEVRSGTLILNELSDSNFPIGTVTVKDGASLVLNSDNSGFDSITLDSGASLVLKTNTAFKNAGNKATGGAILGLGTIVVDLTDKDSVLNLTEASNRNLAGGLSNTDADRFTGSVRIKQGTVNFSESRDQKYKAIKWNVEDGGRILISGEKANENIVAGLILAGTGIEGATDAEKKAAIAFTETTGAITANVSLSDDATIYVASGKTGTFSGGWNSNGHALTVSGSGTLEIRNTAGNSGASKVFNDVYLNAGVTLSMFSAESTTAATTIGNLILKGDANLQSNNHAGYWKVSSLSLGSSVSSAELTLKDTHSSNHISLFEFGAEGVNGGNFVGTIKISQENTGSYRHVAAILSGETVAEKAAISFLDAKSHATETSVLSLGVNANSVTIGGIESSEFFSGLENRLAVFSGTIATQTEGNKASSFQTSWIRNAAVRTLEIETAESKEYTFHGQFLNNLNLVKSGAGTQILAGTSASFDGTASVTGGSLVLKNAQALGSSGSVSVSENAILSLTTADTDTAESFAFSKAVSGAGTLKKEGAGVAKATGALSVGTLDISEGSLVLGADSFVGGISGSATLEGNSAERVLSLTGTAGKTFSGTIKNLNITSSGTQTFTDVKWQGAEADFAYTGTLKVAAGTLTISGENSGFSGKVEMAGGAIEGTLQLGVNATLTATAAGASFVDNLTLSGGSTVEWTKLHSEGEGATQKQWFSVGTLNLAGTEDAVVLFKIADSLTPAGAGGNYTKYTLFEFDKVQNNGTDIASSDLSGKTSAELFAALGGNIKLVDSTGGDYGWTGIVLDYVEGASGEKGKIQIYQSALAQELHWVGDGDAEGGWTQTDVWADESETKTTFTAMSSVTLEEIDDLARTITVSGIIEPASISVTGGNYTLKLAEDAAAGSTIKGSANLYVSGGTLTVDLTNTFNGGAQILTGATVNVGANAALGTGEVQLSGSLNFKEGVTEFKNALSNYNGSAGAVTKDGETVLTLSGDRSQFTGTLDVNAGTVVLANGKGTEKFLSIDIAEGATVAAWGDAKDQSGSWGAYKTSSLMLGQVSGAGTLLVNSPISLGEKTFFSLDLTGSTFTGTVELNAVDLAVGTEENFAEAKASKLADATVVRLANNASLNFFNDSQTGFAKNIEVADSNGAIRAYQSNSGVIISGDVYGAGTLTLAKDGGTVKFTGSVGTEESSLGGLVLLEGKNDSGVVVSAIEISGENSSINVSGDVVLSGASATINTNGTIGGTLTVNGAQSTLTLGGDLKIGSFDRVQVSGGDGRSTSILEGAMVSVKGTVAFGNYENLDIKKSATFSSQTITNTWGLTVSLAEDARLSAGELSLNTPSSDAGRVGLFAGTGDNISVELGKISLGGDVSRVSFENVSVKIGADGIVGSGDQKFIQFKDATVSVLGEAMGWAADANVKLNGGATTFDVGEGQEITLNGTITEAVETETGTEGEEGYVAATSSALIKNGAGTLTLGKANANKGGTTLNAGTLKFTSKDGVTLSGSYTFADGMLAAGEGTTLTLGAGTAFSGAVVYTNDKNGKLLVSEDLSITGEGNSLTLHEKANVEIASGKTLSLGALSFTGNGSKIGGEGTLSLAGTVAVDNNRTNTITSGLALSENTVLAISKGTLEIESEDISTGGKTLTKTGAGTLTLNTDAVYDFDGSFSLQGGTVNVGSRELTISDTHSFELANGATLEGDLVLEKGSSATLGAGKITSDVTLSGATLEFSGATSVGGKLLWTDSNTITLDAEFRKTITSTPYTLISFDSKEGDNANLTFTDVEIYGRRSFTLDIGEKKIDLLATGTLVWNANVATWTTNSEEEADWTLEQTSGNTTSAFLANDYVEFRDSGSIVIADDTIQTSGVVFNIANNGSFRLNAPTPATGEDGQPTEEQKIVKLTDAVYDNGNTTGKSAGLTVVAGNVTIGNYIVNDLSSVTISSGSLTVFNVDALGIVDKTDSENEKIATLTIGGGVNDDGTPKSATLNISLPGDDEKTEDVNESVGIVDQKVAIVNAGIISVVNANTTVEVSGAISGANAKLTKTGWGALKIKRDSTLGMLAVDSGRLELVGNADAALSIKSVQIGNQGEMFLVGDTDGANTRLDALTVNGKLTVTDGNTETPGLGAYRTGTLQGSGNISGNLYIGEDTSFDVVTNNADGSSTTTNYKGTAVSGNLTLTGSIASYGTEDAALYKKGTGTLTLVSAEKENDVPKAFTLDASVIHEAGTLAFTHGGVISKNYTIAENATAKLSFNGVNASELSAGITLGTGSSTTIENSGNGTLKINGVSSSGTTKTTLAGTNITLSGDTVDFGKLTKIDDTGVLSALYVNANNVKVDATTFTAGYVAFGNGASLTISKDTTATANALYVGESVSATLDLTDGAKFSVGTDEEISVFGGTGTLNVKGGTLELKGATYGDEDAPSIVLDDATLAFNVTGAEDAVGAYLDGVSTAEGSTGTIEKTGAGTLMVMEGLVELVFGGEVQDLSFDGEISVTEGNMMLFATASQAEVEIASDTALEFAGSAELADSVDGVNTLAESLSGAGTLNVSGELYVNDADSAFNGTIKASGGTLYVSGATSDWMANGTDRVLFIESGTPLVGTGTAAGKIATYDGSATLTAVSLSGRSIFDGAAEDKALTVKEVSATAGSHLTLQGYGTLGAMKFAEANTDNTIVIGSGANWTIDGKSENLEKLSVSGLVTVAHTGALGSAKVLSSGKIIFDAEGTYANLFNLDKGAVIEAKKNTSLTGSFWHTDGSNPAVTFVAGENAKLTLSDSFIDWTTPTFETKDATATIAVDVTSSVKILNSGSKLSGAGTFEKLGDKKLLITADAGTIGAVAVTAGTLEFGANAKLAVAEGGAGTLSVAKDAILEIAGTKLGDWKLTGEGSAKVSGTASLGVISSAKDVALSGQLSVSGNISDSSLKFADENTKLTTTGTAAQSVTGTLSGATVTLVNENKAGVTYDAALANDVNTLVLTAASGVNGAVMNAAYAGSLTKTLDGEWTVSDYTFGKTADQKLTVSGGTLIWKGVKLEANAGAISLEKSATLKINGLASGDTLSAEIDGNGTLEIAGTGTAATPLKLDTTAASDSKWMLHVSGGSQVQTSKNLPGALWIEGEGSVLDLNYASEQTVENSRYLVSSGATLKLSGTGTLTLKDSGDSTNPHTVSGTVEISDGKLVQSGNVAWDPYGTVEIGTDGELAVNVGGSVNNNNATLEGDGKLTIEKTAASGYRFGGEISGFAGTVDIQSGATVKLAKQLFDNAEVKVDGTLNLELSGTPVNDQGEIVPRNLKNISGAGTLVIAAPDDFYTRYGIYDYDTTTNTFAGTLKVESGVLSVEADKATSLAATKVEVGGTSPAEYYEGMWQGASWVGITTGGFLQLKDGNNYDVASLYGNAKFNFGDKAGTIYSGGTFRAAKDFGVGKNNLFVLDNATLTLTNGASVDGGVFVKSDGSLVVDYGDARLCGSARAFGKLGKFRAYGQPHTERDFENSRYGRCG